MLPWRLQTTPEKAELQELNNRLYYYMCRVRDLERENLLLEEELRGWHGQEDLWAKGQARYAEEARVLRQQLEELSWATTLAESERDALRRELRELQQLGAEARAVRGRLDAELGAQRRELQEALGARAALEALLGRLQAERSALDAAHERNVREVRARATGLSLSYRARPAGPVAPPPRLQEVHNSYTLLVAESWRETVQLYEDEVRELEEALRRGLESRREAEEETRLCAREAEALQREARELEQLRARLEEELLRMQEVFELQAQERQRVIDGLEDEKATLTMAMNDRLRDCQKLVQVKTGLSLEVATYRALLEGESNPEILTWTGHTENIPQEFRNTSYQHFNTVLQRENERNLFQRQKAPPMHLNHRAGVYANRSVHLGPQTTIRSAARGGFLGSGYSSRATVQQDNDKTANNQTGFRTFSPTYCLLRKAEIQLKALPERPKTEGASDAASRIARGSTVAQDTYRERQDNMAAGASENVWSNERTVILGKKTEAKATREQGRNIPVIIQTKQAEKLFDSKEKASEERNLRWEELTKLDKEARKRESEHIRGKPKGKESLKEKNVREREIPVRLEASQGSIPEVSPKGFQTPGKKAVGGETETKERRFRLDTSNTASSLKDDSMTKTIAENVVSSILEQFTQSPDTEASVNSFPDTKVTYMERKELPFPDRKTKTELIVESKLTEDIDVSSEAGLDYLLSKNAKEVELKGNSTERMIGEIINLGLKGRDGKAKVINVEIVEEPMSYVGEEKAEEFSTLFKVEEVDDVSPGSKGLVEEKEGDGEAGITSVSQHRRNKQPPHHLTHVEEVTEAGDWEGEQSYIVSTPDEHLGGHDRDEGSVYGQIHIEEESTIKYSWQDEIVQGTRKRKTDDTSEEKVVKPWDIPASPLEGELRSSHWIEPVKRGEFHAEPTVIEKEIKIPHEFHTSIKGVFSKEPKHQLGEVIGQLEENLPERVREELSVLTQEGVGEPGVFSVDVQKVQTFSSGSMTLVAEVNLSQEVDAEKLDLDELHRCEASEIEKAVESAVRESLTKRRSNQELVGSPSKEGGVEAPVTGISFKRWATRELYSPSCEEDAASQASSSTEQAQGPVLATVEVSSPKGLVQSHVLEDIRQSVRHIKIAAPEMWRTEQVLSEGARSAVGEMDVSHAAATPSSARWTQEFTVRFPADKEAAAPGVSDRGTWRDTGGRREPTGGGTFQASAGDGTQAHGPKDKEEAAFSKTVQLQRMVDQRSVVSDEKKVALLYLDSEDGEESDGHWF
ncbi:PREDICTED: synemin [Chrysochloris asiatica]|uniref:Synemin n=1 Tax=Chrysochloris asiatica TaxID=185453 RepID=A0A9B0U5F7_CHRAS|nr:PREDICTED: synemin [Chrysochloris asiatica]